MLHLDIAPEAVGSVEDALRHFALPESIGEPRWHGPGGIGGRREVVGRSRLVPRPLACSTLMCHLPTSQPPTARVQARGRVVHAARQEGRAAVPPARGTATASAYDSHVRHQRPELPHTHMHRHECQPTTI
jgi:hypothetical protein